MTNILVTGGAGFIGSHLTDALCQHDDVHVVVFDNISTGKMENVNKKTTLMVGDIRDEKALDYIFGVFAFDYVFHLAAQINLRHSITHPREDTETNIVGSANLIEKCVKHEVKKLIFSSTGGAIYDPNGQLPFTEAAPVKPSSPYGLSKATVEQLLEITRTTQGLDYVSLRYSNVFGPRQNGKSEAGVVSIFIENLMNEKDITIFGDGTQTRDFVYVDDVVKANLIAMNLSGVYNVSTGVETNVNYIANKLIEKIGNTKKVNYAPRVEGEMMRCVLNSDKLTKETSWHPVVSFDEGLEKTVESFRAAKG